MTTFKKVNAFAAEEAKRRVRDQYRAAGDAYVRSTGHATGSDLDRMVEVARPQPGDRLLDVATGGGHVARVFAPHVGQVVASDLTPEILEHAGRFLAGEGLANIEMAIVDAEHIPYLDGSFEIVTCRIAPHHFPDPGAFTGEAARVLCPGGRFVLVDSTVPDGEAGTFFNEFEQRRDPSHVRSLTIREWEHLILASGLTLEMTETFPKRHDFADWTARSRMTPADRDALAATMIGAAPAIRDQFAAEIEGAALVGFTDTKTLFLAIRPGGGA